MDVSELHSYLKSQGLNDGEIEALAKKLVEYVQET